MINLKAACRLHELKQMNKIEQSPLGKAMQYVDSYAPELLYPISRTLSRKLLGIEEGQALPFKGVDVWNCYEVSWLTPSGKPVVMLVKVTVPASSGCIIESKSFKLYLNSFNQTVFKSTDEVKACLIKDLSHVAGLPVEVMLHDMDALTEYQVMPAEGICIDGLEIEISRYSNPSSAMLKTSLQKDGVVSEYLYSHLLKSNCPVTGQPDWASVFIQYQAHQNLDATSLLQYIISFRQHADFHEHCVERIFMDLYNVLQPSALEVYARYTRRGGLDINPYRSLDGATCQNKRSIRQ